ncbi:MAG: Ig-like domain-containing protein [Gemmatimonadetes bacterium]|nr:Ig-like domain-containing protein [Gemmatimonadota bacterium]
MIVLIAGCGDDDGGTGPLPDPPRPTSIRMNVEAVELTELGSTVQLAAEVLDQNGNAMAATLSWSSGDTAVAVVDGSGLVTANGNGVATISAAVGNAVGTTKVTVADVAVKAAKDRAALAALYEATDGRNWSNSDNWLTEASLEDWHGVDTDADGRVIQLNLVDNGLSGTIPAELGDLKALTGLDLLVNDLSGTVPNELGYLSSLQRLDLSYNKLTGALPGSFIELGLLHTLIIEANVQLCAPGTADFVTWLRGVEYFGGQYCGEPDKAVLEHLYQTAGGPDWTNSAGWLETPVLSEWYGVTADSIGRVLTLDLTRNGLVGQLGGDWAELEEMTRLRLTDNALSGRLPFSLTRLRLVEFHYSATDLCTPPDASFRAWLDVIASHAGTGIECPPLPDRVALEALHGATGGSNWVNADNWLTEAPLDEWYGVDTDASGRVVRLDLGNNALSGVIPPELGDLDALEELVLWGNELTGAIPPELSNLPNLARLHLEANRLSGAIPTELGNLSALESLGLSLNDLSGPIPRELGGLERLVELDLWGNNLSGPVPPELGSLARLLSLDLESNRLSGPIPSELGELSNLQWLYLSGNALTGPIPRELNNLGALVSLNLSSNALSGGIPPQLGRLSTLASLTLDNNDLTGSVPPELGGMSSLLEMSLTNNARMSGPLPVELTDLNLEALLAGGTDLCAPVEPRFQAWLRRVHKRRIHSCERAGASMAYLAQAVQSREHPVPLVADEDALLRVFVTAASPTTATLPPVRARFFLHGSERHVVNVPATTTPIPTEVLEGDLGASANAEVPGEIVQPGLEMVIEIDPDGTLDPGLGVTKRIPKTGRTAIDVQKMPVLALTVIPFLWSGAPDSAIVEAASAMAADPQGHELLWETRTLLPIGDLDVTAHAPVLTSTNDVGALIDETEAIRALEGGSSHYMGVMSGEVAEGTLGIAATPGRVSASVMDPVVIAHELGHNLSLLHAPCGGAADPDPSFPYSGGSTGAWGYDTREGGSLIDPDGHKDIMSYCGPEWISDYFFTNALRFRLFDEGVPQTAAVLARQGRSLLLWGGMDADGELFLNPAFVVDARPVLPTSQGGHRITGRAADGGELFTLDFAMPEFADGGGRSSFAFVLPAESGWADQLASITLSGPDGSATLDSETDAPMAILFDPASGQVRGIVRNPPRPEAPTAFAPPQRGLDLLFSRGIPDAAAWSR